MIWAKLKSSVNSFNKTTLHTFPHNSFCSTPLIKNGTPLKTPWKSKKGSGGVSAFLDYKPNDLKGYIGDSWPYKYLEKKSFSDLHKLWFVLLRERNRLCSDRWFRREAKIEYDEKKTERFHKVENSMRRIRHLVKMRNLKHKREEIRKTLGEEAIERLESKRKTFLVKKERPKKMPKAYTKKFHDYLHLSRSLAKF